MKERIVCKGWLAPQASSRLMQEAHEGPKAYGGRFALVVALLAFSLAGCHNLQTSGQALDFGEVYVGTSKTMGPVTWTNTTRRRITVQKVKITPATVTVFTVAPTTFPPGTAVNAGRTTPNVNIIFSPTAEATYNGMAELQRQAGVTANERAVRGEGKYQIVNGDIGIGGHDLTPSQYLDFGTVTLPGGQAVTKQFNLINQSLTNDIRVTAATWTVGGQGFTVTAPTVPFTVRRISRVRVTISFMPPRVGRPPVVFNDAVTFSDATGANTAGTAVIGRGLRGGGG